MSSVYESIQNSIREVGKSLNLSDTLVESMVQPNRTIEETVEVPGVGSVAMYRVQFNNALGPYKGGIRFHPEVNLDEVKALSITMMLKCSLAGIPLGGAKGGAALDPRELSDQQLESVSRSWMKLMQPYVGVDRDIPAPDVNTNGKIMAWMLDEYEQLEQTNHPGVITGKPLELGGSLGREAATSQGGAIILREILKSYPLNVEQPRVVIQGFGNVGSFAATILYDQGFKIIGLSDSKGAVYNPEGLNPHHFVDAKVTGQTIQDSAKDIAGTLLLTNEELLEQETEILIPAALAEVIDEKNAEKISAKIILELANNPTTQAAEKILDSRGIMVVPDFLANSGGVTVSYFEWVQNRQQYYWNLEEVNQKLDILMTQATTKVIKRAQTESSSLRKAALKESIMRIAKAMSFRKKL
jgi:glutamate dehydrogenase